MALFWPKKLQPLRPWIVLTAGFLVHFILGSVFTYGNYMPYIVSYIRVNSHPSDLRYGTGVWLYAATSTCQPVTMYFGGWLDRKIKLSLHLSTLIGGGLLVTGVLLSYFTVQYSFWLLLVTYGLLYGLGIGMAYVGPLACGMRWLPKWKGTANGFVLSGSGISALFFNAIQTAYINPENNRPSYAPYESNPEEKYFTDTRLLDRVPYSFLVLGAIYGILLISSLFLCDPPHKDDPVQQLSEDNATDVEDSHLHDKEMSSVMKTLHPHSDSDTNSSGADSNEELQAEESDYAKTDRASLIPRNRNKCSMNISIGSELHTLDKLTGLTPWQMLHKPNFYLIWAILFFTAASMTILESFYKVFGITVSKNDHFLTAVGSVSAIFNFIGRLFWGYIADKFSHKMAMVSLNGLMAALALTFYASTEGREPVFFLWVCGIFFCIGGNNTLFPTIAADSFGPKCINENVGLLYTTWATAVIAAALLSQFLHNWVVLFFLTGAFLLISYLLALLYHPKHFTDYPEAK